MIRREHHEAERMERLSAEYLTLAAEAQGERFDALLGPLGLSDDELAAVTASAARGPLFAGYARPKHAASTSRRACRYSSPASLWLMLWMSPPFSMVGSIAGPRPPAAGAGTQEA